jgi:uncharacterized protein YecE (DUF72 family)
VGGKICAAFEFRHPSWFDEDVFERLSRRNLALCIADTGDGSPRAGDRSPRDVDRSPRATRRPVPRPVPLHVPVRVTADYAYFRLRDEGYTPDDIARWADTIARETASCRDVFVYFKHEEEGKGPEFAALLRQRLGV